MIEGKKSAFHRKKGGARGQKRQRNRARHPACALLRKGKLSSATYPAEGFSRVKKQKKSPGKKGRSAREKGGIENPKKGTLFDTPTASRKQLPRRRFLWQKKLELRQFTSVLSNGSLRGRYYTWEKKTKRRVENVLSRSKERKGSALPEGVKESSHRQQKNRSVVAAGRKNGGSNSREKYRPQPNGRVPRCATEQLKKRSPSSSRKKVFPQSREALGEGAKLR